LHDEVQIGDAHSAIRIANVVRENSGADIGLAVLGFPEGQDNELVLKGAAAACGGGMEKTCIWQMGGDIPTIQVRGSVIGLNTLRLALLE
jgi:hypothetical protein